MHVALYFVAKCINVKVGQSVRICYVILAKPDSLLVLCVEIHSSAKKTCFATLDRLELGFTHF